MTKYQWVLIDAATGNEIKRGDLLITFRGEIVTLQDLQPPYVQGVEGKIICRNRKQMGLYYPAMVGARFEKRALVA